MWRCDLPAIGVNYLGAVGQGVTEADTGIPFAVDTHAPALASTVSGLMPATNVLTVNIASRPGEHGRVLSADFLYAQDVLTTHDVSALAAAWLRELEGIAAEVAALGDPGLSPSDLPGTGITQADIDTVARAYPGAAIWPLTPLQHGFFLQSALADAGGEDAVDVYVGQAVLRLAAPVDDIRLRRAVEGLFSHHPALRSSYPDTPAGPVQRALAGGADAAVDVAVQVVSDPDPNPGRQILRAHAEQMSASLDVRTAPPFCVRKGRGASSNRRSTRVRQAALASARRAASSRPVS